MTGRGIPPMNRNRTSRGRGGRPRPTRIEQRGNAPGYNAILAPVGLLTCEVTERGLTELALAVARSGSMSLQSFQGWANRIGWQFANAYRSGATRRVVSYGGSSASGAQTGADAGMPAEATTAPSAPKTKKEGDDAATDGITCDAKEDNATAPQPAQAQTGKKLSKSARRVINERAWESFRLWAGANGFEPVLPTTLWEMRRSPYPEQKALMEFCESLLKGKVGSPERRDSINACVDCISLGREEIRSGTRAFFPYYVAPPVEEDKTEKKTAEEEATGNRQ